MRQYLRYASLTSTNPAWVGEPCESVEQRCVLASSFQLLKSNNLDSELTASIIFSRRRRIGAFRGSKNKRQKFYAQDMARMARAGFSYYIAQKVIGIENREELEQMVDNNTFDP